MALTEAICYPGDYVKQSLSKPPKKETFLWYYLDKSKYLLFAAVFSEMFLLLCDRGLFFLFELKPVVNQQFCCLLLHSSVVS